jgi:hypothetical protein
LSLYSVFRPGQATDTSKSKGPQDKGLKGAVDIRVALYCFFSGVCPKTYGRSKKIITPGIKNLFMKGFILNGFLNKDE